MKGYASKKLLMPYMRLAKNISHYSIHQIFAEQNVHAYWYDKAYVPGSPVCADEHKLILLTGQTW